jgi:polyhydroxyalkanoate synthase subunit PhaE
VTATDPVKAFADFWTAKVQAFMTAQQQAGKAFADGMQSLASGRLPAMPEMSTDLSTTAADLARASQSVTALWSAATALSGAFAKISPASATAGDITVEAAFRKMVDPRNWMAGTGEIDEVLGRMAEGPRFADLWEIERRYARVLQAWMTVRRRGLEHNTVVLEAWLKAGRQFSEELNGQTSAGGQPPDAKASFALWTETANKQLLETQHSEPFLETQAAMIRASTELRMAQQELVEHFGKQYGFPTRTELDDVHRTVTELRREMRAMRREQRIAAPISTPAAAPAEEPSVTRGPATRKRGAR